MKRLAGPRRAKSAFLVGHLALTLLAFSTPVNAAGMWASDGVVPSQHGQVRSPDGRHEIAATGDGLQLVGVGAARSARTLPMTAMWPLWEVIWSPRSDYVAINSSDGGAIGTWESAVFKLNGAGQVSPIAAADSVRRAARSFARCDEPEALNIALVGWERNGDVARVVAQVPPHSSCRNMGQLRGYRVSLPSGKVLEALPEALMRRRWASQLGPVLTSN